MNTRQSWDHWAQIGIEAIMMPIVSFLGLIGKDKKFYLHSIITTDCPKPVKMTNMAKREGVI